MKMDDDAEQPRTQVNIRMTDDVQRLIYAIILKVKKDSGFLPTKTAIVEMAVKKLAAKMKVEIK